MLYSLFPIARGFCLAFVRHQREASRGEASAGIHAAPPIWRGRDGSRRRVDAQHDPRDLAPVGTFRIRVGQAYVGDGMLFVVDDEHGIGRALDRRHQDRGAVWAFSCWQRRGLLGAIGNNLVRN